MTELERLKLEILKRLVFIFPAPRDKDGNAVCLIRDWEGEVIEWPKGVSVSDLDDWLETRWMKQQIEKGLL